MSVKTVGFIPFSYPLAWWDETNVAHNRIWSRAVMELAKRGHRCVAQGPCGKRVPFFRETNKHADLVDCDALVLFCGPFTPIAPGSVTERTLRVLRDYQGPVAFVTCDYLLQFDPRVSRYGNTTRSWPEDSFTANKQWTYVMHGPIAHHFPTTAGRAKMKAFGARPLSVPLNMAGIPPTGVLPAQSTPQFDLLYCGAFRPDRKEFFHRYFSSPQAKRWFVSTSKADKWKAVGAQCRILPTLGGALWNKINASCVQIIAGDDRDRNENTPLPTRYWESTAANTLPVFDKSACGHWRTPMDSLFVDGPGQLADMIADFRANPKKRLRLLEAQAATAAAFDPWTEWRMPEWTIA